MLERENTIFDEENEDERVVGAKHPHDPNVPLERHHEVTTNMCPACGKAYGSCEDTREGGKHYSGQGRN